MHRLVHSSIVLDIEQKVVGLGRSSPLLCLDLSRHVLLGSINALILAFLHHWPHDYVFLSVIHERGCLDGVQLLQNLGKKVNCLILRDIRRLNVIVLITTDAAQDVLLCEVLLIDEIGSVILFFIILNILLVVKAVLQSEVIVAFHVLFIKIGRCRINEHVISIFWFLIFVAFELFEVDLALLIYFSTILVHSEVASREEVHETSLMVKQLLKVWSELLDFIQDIESILAEHIHQELVACQQTHQVVDLFLRQLIIQLIFEFECLFTKILVQ
mgnify:CR=1 FL=1